MTNAVFFVPDLSTAREGELFQFEGGDAKHVIVKRIERGESIDLSDGDGTRVIARLVEADASVVRVVVDSISVEPLVRPRITLVQALSKAGRDELAIEMATELGVDRVIAWQANRSIVRWQGNKQQKNLEKWQKVLLSATKQSRRSRIPKLEFAKSVKDVIDLTKEEQVVVMHESATTPITSVQLSHTRDITLVVGPEGGITVEELERLGANGASIVLVGSTVMRVSTATAAGLTALNIATGRV